MLLGFLVGWGRVATLSGLALGAVLLLAVGTVGVGIALTGNVGQGRESMVATLEQLVASAGSSAVSTRGIGGQSGATGGDNGAGTVNWLVLAVAIALLLLSVTLLVLVDEVLLCWGLDHVDEHGLNLDATWVVLDVDLAQHNCWGLVEHNGRRLDHQWGMVNQHLGGWTSDNDGSGTMDQNLALVLWVGDRRGEGVALGVHRFVWDVLVGAIAALSGMSHTRGISGASTSGIAQTTSGAEFTTGTTSGSNSRSFIAAGARAVALLSARAVALLAARAVALLSAVVRAGACLQRIGERERERVCVRESARQREQRK